MVVRAPPTAAERGPKASKIQPVIQEVATLVPRETEYNEAAELSCASHASSVELVPFAGALVPFAGAQRDAKSPAPR